MAQKTRLRRKSRRKAPAVRRMPPAGGLTSSKDDKAERDTVAKSTRASSVADKNADRALDESALVTGARDEDTRPTQAHTEVAPAPAPEVETEQSARRDAP